MTRRYFIRSLFWRLPFTGPFRRGLYKREYKSLKREVFGLEFPNPVGLAAGIDRNCEFYNPLSDYGFGFVEISCKKGVKAAIAHIQKDPPRVLVAANLERNPAHKRDEDILKDYTVPFSLLYDFVDMFVIDISTDGNSDLEDIAYLSDILDELLSLRLCYEMYRPMLLKVSHKIETQQLDEILNFSMLSGIDGIIATNLQSVKYISAYTKGRLPIVGSGNIRTPQKAAEMLDAGASLIEIYSGFTHRGPRLVKRILRRLASERDNLLDNKNLKNL